MQRFFVDEKAVSDGVVKITGEDARHISYSLRMRRGERISVCSAGGRLYECELTDFGEGFVTAAIREETECRAEPPYRVRLFQAVSKGDKMETIVQKAVECGVGAVTPFESRNCVARWDRDPEKKRERLCRIAAEAAKQSRRGLVPPVTPVISFHEAVREAAEDELALFCYEGGGTRPIGECLTGALRTVSLIVGPEGGFTGEEAREASEAGLILCGLGPRILRCETAPVFALACLSFRWELGGR